MFNESAEQGLILQDDIEVTITLCNIENGKKQQTVQNLKQVKINKDNGSRFAFIFRPTHTFNAMVFTCKRRVEEYQANIGIKLKVRDEENTFCTVNNILETVANSDTPYLGQSSIIKMGVQSKPGLLFCINGEQIMMNSSGFYEMLADIQIENLGFVIKDEGELFKLIVDYQYIG